jgi:hypothetical protein
LRIKAEKLRVQDLDSAPLQLKKALVFPIFEESTHRFPGASQFFREFLVSALDVLTSLLEGFFLKILDQAKI